MLRLALHWQILIGMVVGAGLGAALNIGAGQRTSESPPGAARPWKITDDRDRIEIELGDQRYVVDAGWDGGAAAADDVQRVESLSALAEAAPEAHRLFQQRGRSLARRVGDAGSALGGLFLRMLKMVAVPLIVTSLISGVVGLGGSGGVGGMFGRTLAYYVATSLLAICTGLAMVNLIRPGAGGADAAPPVGAAADAAEGTAVEGSSLGEVLWNQLENLIPENPFAALAGGDFLSIIAFSLFFGVTAVLVGGRSLETVAQLASAGFEIMMRLTMAIIHLAPVGVLFMMLAATASQGLAVFASLSWYMLTVALALLFHAAVTLPLILYFVAKRNPWQYAKSMSPALLTAFSSASSNGTLPLTLTCVEQRAGVDNRVSSFVLPLGATVNMDGTALYEAVAVLFIAQLSPEINFTFTQQIVVVVTALLASIGAAGIPHAGLVMMIIILQAVGLPTEKQALIIAVDRVLDMARTCVNVWSDSCGCAVIQRFTPLAEEPNDAPA